MKNKNSYSDLGKLIQAARLTSDSMQSELAKQLGLEQQTISRWESGQSRPTQEKLNGLISLFKIKETNEWSLASGYPNIKAYNEHSTTQATTSFTHPFPLHLLSDEDFERFCLQLISFLHPEANVYRYGGSGHKQEGIDIRADFDKTLCFTFQCKRHKNFGPQNALEAIKRHTLQSNKKVILLSRIATPKTRDAVKEHQDWQVWDVEDISRIIRFELTLDEGRRLVRTFFPGHEYSLLGIQLNSPWQTAEEFFLPYSSSSRIFNHAWKLVGRKKDIDLIQTDLENDNLKAIVITGSAGTGKSKLLNSICSIYIPKHKNTLLRVAAYGEKITKESIDELGSDTKILIVDDAHDRDGNDINLLFNLAAIPASNIKLLFLTRPYSLDKIIASAANMGLSHDLVKITHLQPLSKTEATTLSKDILTTLNGPVELAEQIADITYDCPLATTLGSYIIAKSPINPNILSNDKIFKDYIFSKFQNIITGEIGNSSDTNHFREILKIITLVQPFNSDDPDFLSLVHNHLSVPEYEIKRLVNLLNKAGVLTKAGREYRILPDALADFIAETACFENKRKTGYAQEIFDKIISIPSTSLLERLLLNLGKLDWRLCYLAEMNDQVLTPIWKQLVNIEDKVIPAEKIINAATAVAIYQPKNALDLADIFIERKCCTYQLPNLLKNIAYNLDYVRPICQRLWEIGKNDGRPTNQYSYHPLRILAELCEIKPGKMLSYTSQVVDYGISLINNNTSWQNIHTPLEIILPALATEAEKTEFNNNTFTMTWYSVNPDNTKSIREKVIFKILELIEHKNISIAILATQALGNALRYPVHNKCLEDRTHWTRDFTSTLTKLKNIVSEKTIDNIVLVELHKNISSHAYFDMPNVKKIAAEIISLLPLNIDFRASQALIDGWGRLWERDLAYNEKEKLWQKELDNISSELISTFKPPELIQFTEEKLRKILTQKLSLNASPHRLIHFLTDKSIDFSLQLIEYALANKNSFISRYTGPALSKIISTNRTKGLHYSQIFIETDDMNLITCLAEAYDRIGREKEPYTQDEIKLIRKLCAVNNIKVLSIALNHLISIAKHDPKLSIEIFLTINFGFSLEITAEVLSIFYRSSDFPMNALTKDNYEIIFKKLLNLNAVGEHWIDEFIAKASKFQPDTTISFLKKRVEISEENENPNYEALPGNYHPHVPFSFRETKDPIILMKNIRNWICNKGSNKKYDNSRQRLFVKMFSPIDALVLDFLDDWASVASEDELKIISDILCIGSSQFDIANYKIIEKILLKSDGTSLNCIKHVEEQLYRAAMPMFKHGTPGGPYAEDLTLKEKSQHVLSKLEQSSPAKQFYEKLVNYANLCIEEQSVNLERTNE